MQTQASETSQLSIELRERIAVVTFRSVTLARPFIADLVSALKSLEADPAVHAIIFTGQRSVFMTGADRSELASLQSKQQVEAFLATPHKLVRQFLTSKKLLVAAINGFCLGGGLEFALACDFRTCAGDLTDNQGMDLPMFGFPEASLGVVPSVGGAYLAARIIGVVPARRLCLTGVRLSASAALSGGLVDLVAKQAILVSVTEQWINTVLARSSSYALMNIKRLINEGIIGGLDHSMTLASAALHSCCESGDKDEYLSRAHAGNCLEFKGRGEPSDLPVSLHSG